MFCRITLEGASSGGKQPHAASTETDITAKQLTRLLFSSCPPFLFPFLLAACAMTNGAMAMRPRWLGVLPPPILLVLLPLLSARSSTTVPTTTEKEMMLPRNRRRRKRKFHDSFPLTLRSSGDVVVNLPGTKSRIQRLPRVGRPVDDETRAVSLKRESAPRSQPLAPGPQQMRAPTRPLISLLSYPAVIKSPSFHPATLAHPLRPSLGFFPLSISC